jgi:pyruvate formate lyase activating enzyme
MEESEKTSPANHSAGRWWHTVEDGARIQCDLCPRACTMQDGDRGFCFVRQNVDNEMILTTYGKSTGFCIDPIEKKPLNHFLPGSSVLSFGTAGCNLGCRFCQNWEISKSREIELLSEQATPEQIADAAVRAGCSSVAFTYNDPVIWAEYAIDTAKACHDRGLKTVAVTAGYIMPEARKEFYSVIDAANVDLKAFTELFYQQITLSSIEPVLDTLRWLKHESNVWFEITNLVIPTKNDSPDEIARMCDWIMENVGDQVPVHFTAFHPDFRMQDIPPTPPSTLKRARKQALDAGIKYVYTGNVVDEDSQSTYCPGCKKCLIERDWFKIGAYHIEDGACPSCGQKIAGVFDKRKGDWGARRVPVFFSRK